MSTPKKKTAKRKPKTYSERQYYNHGVNQWEEGFKAGKAEGRKALQRELQDLLGVTFEIQGVEADMERHRRQDHEL